MKIIFLDFDGVLNSTPSFITWRKARQEGLVHQYANPDASCVTLVNRLILADPEIRVVLSTSWRTMGDIPFLRNILINDFGLSKDAAAMVIDKTCDPKLSGRRRGHEIAEWLLENASKGITHYVILDDNSDMTPEQIKSHFVQTNFDDGFRLKDYHKARYILDLMEEKFSIF